MPAAPGGEVELQASQEPTAQRFTFPLNCCLCLRPAEEFVELPVSYKEKVEGKEEKTRDITIKGVPYCKSCRAAVNNSTYLLLVLIALVAIPCLLVGIAVFAGFFGSLGFTTSIQAAFIGVVVVAAPAYVVYWLAHRLLPGRFQDLGVTATGVISSPNMYTTRFNFRNPEYAELFKEANSARAELSQMPPPPPLREGTPVGRVTRFFSIIGVGGVAIVELTSALRVGDEILVEGKQNSFRQRVEQMEMEHQKVSAAEAGKSIGLKLKERAREGDIVFVVPQVEKAVAS